jgi:hypothetical protein
MARKADEKRLRAVVQLIENQPGYKPGEYAQLMGWHRQTFNRLLVQLHDRGVLLSEDRQGRIWLFGVNRKNQ